MTRNGGWPTCFGSLSSGRRRGRDGGGCGSAEEGERAPRSLAGSGPRLAKCVEKYARGREIDAAPKRYILLSEPHLRGRHARGSSWVTVSA